MNYHNITKDDMRNGDGLRVVLWVAGCEHLCRGCQNPITWDPKGGIPFTVEAEAEIRKEMEKPYVSGITYSGGDPLHHANVSDVTRLAWYLNRAYPDKTQWLYTGYDWDEIKLKPIMQYIDVVVDGEFREDEASIPYHWAGSTNQRVIDVKKSLFENRVVLWEKRLV